MGWPHLVDYNEALQNPQFCFEDPELRNGQVAVDAIGLPLPCTGNFAAVYKVTSPGGTAWAVKCFIREIKGLQQRYQAISSHLQQGLLPFLVEFSYLSQGIRIHGQWFPVVKMRWVEGMPLNDFVRNALNKPRVLTTLAGLWMKLAQELRTAQMAHGDLQHGNVLLVTGTKSNVLRPTLIDYDGMYVPALANKRSGEVGHANYQHPSRLLERAYGPEIDRFAHLVICTALYCLAEKPSLWDRFNNDDNLLFREEDFKTPETSPLFHQLWKLPVSVARIWVGHLLLAALGPLDRVPSLDMLITGGKIKPLAPWQEDQIDSLLASGRGRLRAVPHMKSDKKKSARDEDDSIIRFAEESAYLPLAPEPAPVVPLAPEPAPPADAWWKSAPPPAIATPPENAAVPTKAAGAAFIRNFGKHIKYVFDEHTDLVSSLAFHPRGKHIASASRDNTIRLWDIATGSVLHTLVGHSDGVESVAFNPDGDCLASGGSDGKLVVWSTRHGTKIFTLNAHSRDVNALSFSPDGQRLATGGGELMQPGQVKIWNAVSSVLNLFGRILLTLDGHKETVTSVCYSPDGDFLASGSYDQSVIIWDARRGKQVLKIGGQAGSISCVRYSPNGKKLAIAAGEDVHVLDAANGDVLLAPGSHPGGASSVCFSPNGRWLASTGWDKLVRVWDVKTGRNVQTFSGHTDGILCVAFGPDNKTLASASRDQSVRVWKM